MKGKTLFIHEKLELRLPEMEFADSVFELLKYQRNYLEEWLPWASQTKDINDCQKQIKSHKLFNIGGQKLITFIFYNQILVGSIGLVKIIKDNQSAEIGYWLSQDFQGKGIIVQSCQRIIQHAFEKMQLNRLEINVASSNLKSVRIPEKLNFSLEGTLRDGLYIHDKFHNLKKYSLLKREWKKEDNFIKSPFSK